MTQDDLRSAVYTALGPTADSFPFHVLAAVDTLDGALTHEKWTVCARVLRSLVTLRGENMVQEEREARMRAYVVAAACEIMSKASFSGRDRLDVAIESAMDLLCEEAGATKTPTV